MRIDYESRPLGEGICIVACLSGQEIGRICTAGRPVQLDDGLFWPVYQVYVEPRYRGKGVGAGLYAKLILEQPNDGLVSDPVFRSSPWIARWLIRALGGDLVDGGQIKIRDVFADRYLLL